MIVLNKTVFEWKTVQIENFIEKREKRFSSSTQQA